MSITKPFTFVAGTKARANEVNQNFDVLYSQVNSNISAINTNANDIDTLDSNKANVNGSSSQPFNVQDISNTSTTQAVNAQSMRKALTPLYGYIDGYVISKDSSSPNDTILVTAGSCYDSTNKVVLAKDTSTTKQNLNQGASTTYYIYVKSDNDDGRNADIVISQYSTNPTGESESTITYKYKKIGSYTTDSDGYIDSISYYGSARNSDKNPTNIFSSISPDYGKAITVAYGDYTAEKNGWLSATLNGSDSKNNWGYVYPNGVESKKVGIFQFAASAYDSSRLYRILIPINSGDRVVISNHSSQSWYFIPLKGA